MKNNVKVLDKQTKSLLFSCPIEEIEKAYDYAKNMEEMGIEVMVETPTITQTLKSSIMMTTEEEHQFDQIINQEIEDHDGSCCVENKKSTC